MNNNLQNSNEHTAANKSRTGILLINLGTPDAPRTPEVRAYLRALLSSDRVLDINPVGRWLLLNLIILPFRPRKSAKAYREIWMEDGSPLLVYSQKLKDALIEHFSEENISVAKKNVTELSFYRCIHSIHQVPTVLQLKIFIKKFCMTGICLSCGLFHLFFQIHVS